MPRKAANSGRILIVDADERQALEWFEIALDSVHADGKRILDREVLGMLREDRREHDWDNFDNLGQARPSDHRTFNIDQIPWMLNVR